MNASSADAGDAFQQLIAPVSTTTFFEQYFERDVLHIARNDATYFARLYSVRCVEDALTLGADNPDCFALIKHRSPEITREQMTSDRSAFRFRSTGQGSRSVVDPRSVLAAFAAGYTLNIKDAGAYHTALAQLCNRIQAQLGFYVHSNVYFTPARAQGFDTHYDTHDTLIVQIEGEKHWQIYNPVVALPLGEQPYSERTHDGMLGEPRKICLRAGDSLYIPHGFPHNATAAERRSLHVTFAMAPLRVIDLLDSLVQLAARGDVELRRALPPDWHRDPAFAARFSARVKDIMLRATAPERIPLAAEVTFNQLFAATRTTVVGAFDAFAAFDNICPNSRIRLRDDTPFDLRDRGERLDIVLAAKVVSVPGAARAAFERLASGPATFAQIEALLPADTGLKLVQTLVVEGLVFIDDEP